MKYCFLLMLLLSGVATHAERADRTTNNSAALYEAVLTSKKSAGVLVVSNEFEAKKGTPYLPKREDHSQHEQGGWFWSQGKGTSGKCAGGEKEAGFSSDTIQNQRARSHNIIVRPDTDYTLEIDVKNRVEKGSFRMDLALVRSNPYKITNRLYLPDSAIIDEEFRLVRFPFRTSHDTDHVNLFIRGEFSGGVFVRDLKIREGHPPLSVGFNGGDFKKFPGHGLPEEKTVFSFDAGKENLILDVSLLHHSDRKLQSQKRDKDGNVFRDDSFEFFISHINGSDIWHFCVNAEGSLWDGVGADPNWNSGAEAKVLERTETCTKVRISIPLKSVGYDPALDVGTVRPEWLINVTRNHRLSGGVTYTTWLPVNSYLSRDEYVQVAFGEKSSAAMVTSAWLPKRKGLRERYFRVEKPLYKEVLDGIEGKDSAFIWFHPLGGGNADGARQYGLPYSTTGILDCFAKNRLHLYVPPSDITAERREWAEKSGVGIALYSPYTLYPDFPYNPQSELKILDKLRQALEKDGRRIWGISAGDEVLNLVQYRFFSDKEKGIPAVKAADELIREKYGFGKYASPSSIDAVNEPYQFLAFRRWIFDRITEYHKHIHEFSAQYPHLKFISSDNVGWNISPPFSRWGKYCDIVTGQVSPDCNPKAQRIAMIVKLMSDLSGKEAWPALHLESYPGIFSAAEVTAYLSEAARGGASGLQLWWASYLGALSGKGTPFRYDSGHPPRNEAVLQALRRWREDGKIKFPAPEFAVLVSTDTAWSRSHCNLHRHDHLFTLIGPVLGCSFKYISDLQIEDSDVNLKDYPLILIADSKIQNRATVASLQAYLDQGGKILSFDPEAFSFHTDGTLLAQEREKLFRKARFFTEPIKNYSAYDAAFLEKIRQELNDAGAHFNYPFWRFTFPAAPEEPPKFTEKCLTGNNGYFWMNQYIHAANNTTKGDSYSYNLRPDFPAEQVLSENISFAEGNLTNRLKAFTAGDIWNRRNEELVKSGKLHWGLFTAGWSKLDPVEITFWFAEEKKISTIHLFYSGELPDYKISLPDGSSFNGKGGGSGAVNRSTVLFPQHRCKELTILIPKRETGLLELSEVEIWGE